MTEEREAGGVNGDSAAMARASGPGHAPSSPDGHTEEQACLNCRAVLLGPHCHACGQRAHVHTTIGAFFHDLLHGVFHFEGKIWHTLPMLAWRPGSLTREYIDGRRARYVSPIALFLFCVFLLFASLQFAMPTGTGGIQTTIADATVRQERIIEDLERRRALAVAERKPASAIAAIDARLTEQRSDLANLRSLASNGGRDLPSEFQTTRWVTSIPWLDRTLRHAQANPELVLYKIWNSAYKYSWLLIPISVPFLWLLFPFSRRFGLYDHTVFVTYSLCFMILLVIAVALLARVTGSGLLVAALLVPPWHLYRQLRGAYGLRRAGALWRLAALLLVCLAAMIMFALTVVGLGIA